MAEQTTHPYNSHTSVYNFFFHPLHDEKTYVNVLSIITNIALTILTGMLWLIPFLYLNISDSKKLSAEDNPQTKNVDDAASGVIAPKKETTAALAKMSKELTPENFAECMSLAFESNDSNVIWRGLSFAAENPEDPKLKKLIPTFNFLASSTDVQIGRLIEIARECHANNIIPSISNNGLRKIRLKSPFSSSDDISQSTFWNLLKKVQPLACIEELDAGGYELSLNSGSSNEKWDFVPFINQASAILPNLKEIRFSFDKSVRFDSEVSDGLTLLPFTVNRLKNMEGMGISFPYEKDKTAAYLAAFKDNSLVSQSGSPIQLRAITMGSEEFADDQLQELLTQWPSIRYLDLERTSVTRVVSSLYLEELHIDSCGKLTELDLLHLRHLRVNTSNELLIIKAPEAKEITVYAAKKLKTLQADQAEHLMLHETKLEEVILPSAKTFHVVSPKITIVAAEGPKKLTVPDSCTVGRISNSYDRIPYSKSVDAL